MAAILVQPVTEAILAGGASITGSSSESDTRPGGETGRHSGLKIRGRLTARRAGSSPALGTTFFLIRFDSEARRSNPVYGKSR